MLQATTGYTNNPVQQSHTCLAHSSKFLAFEQARLDLGLLREVSARLALELYTPWQPSNSMQYQICWAHTKHAKYAMEPQHKNGHPSASDTRILTSKQSTAIFTAIRATRTA